MFMKLIALALFLSLCTSCNCENSENSINIFSKMSKEKIEETIKKDLPSGTDLNKVMTYLKRNEFEGGDYNSKENKVYAKVRQDGDWLIKKTICIIFSFDKEKKLESFEVKEVYTGP